MHARGFAWDAAVMPSEQSPVVSMPSAPRYVLAFSIIMLNTDHHSSRVKRKMTREQVRAAVRSTLPIGSLSLSARPACVGPPLPLRRTGRAPLALICTKGCERLMARFSTRRRLAYTHENNPPPSPPLPPSASPPCLVASSALAWAWAACRSCEMCPPIQRSPFASAV